jgi:TetR/AcrR family transcriptional repressor of nem operon
METIEHPKPEMPERRRRLMEAAVRLILRHGHSATTVDMICAEAGVTKGSFFHYFRNKEEACESAMDAWMQSWQEILSQARFEELEDPLDRISRLFQVMEQAYTYPEIDPGCVVGTVAQEQALPNERLREQCLGHFDAWTAQIGRMLAEAKAAHPPKVNFDPDELAWWLQSFVQGSLLLSKARGDRKVVVSNIRHCRAYVFSLFGGTVGNDKTE